ncbi:MAG: hypothetical protein WBZ28_09220, partial [Pseudolabrys sp.]
SLPASGSHTPAAPGQPLGKNKGSTVMIRTAIISVTASFVLFGAWTVNLVSYHPATDLNPLAPLSTNVDRR